MAYVLDAQALLLEPGLDRSDGAGMERLAAGLRDSALVNNWPSETLVASSASLLESHAVGTAITSARTAVINSAAAVRLRMNRSNWRSAG